MVAEIAASDEMRAYFKRLNDDAEECYRIAETARAQGKDPQTFVEIPRAEDLASRVEELLSDYQVEGVADLIRSMTEEYGNREIVAIKVAEEYAKRPAESTERALDRAVRIGLAIITEGILVAPLEGIACTKIGRNDDGSTFADLVFAGPIRASGGTGQAMSVLICDVVRQVLGIGRYIPTEGEVNRFDEEIPLYKQCQHLQFVPTSEEIRTIVSECPVMVDGEGTEQTEISGFRDLPRIATNRVRGGACLVIAEGMCLKASKIKKHVDRLGIEGWDFIGKYLDMHKAVDAGGEEKKRVVEPAEKYLKDMVAGRPIFGHPCRVGGFRLRYGRARTSGLASLAYNPASMYAMDEFMALGTQLKIERPGKACVVTPVNAIEGPSVLLDNGDLVYCGTKEEYLAVRPRVREIVDNGEILVPFGEFCENNHVLVPCGYTLEWHKQELLAGAGSLPDDWRDPTYDRSKEMSARYGVPLHPKFNLFWSDVAMAGLTSLRAHLAGEGSVEGGCACIPADKGAKGTLVELGALHKVRGGKVVVDARYTRPMLDCLGLREEGGRIAEARPFAGDEPLAAASAAAGYEVRARAMTRIGTRMGRPEKAKERAGQPLVQCLFALNEPDSKSDVKDTAAAEKHLAGKANLSGPVRDLNVEMGARRCPECGEETYRCWCRKCGVHTAPFEKRRPDSGPATVKVDVAQEYADALAFLGEQDTRTALKCTDRLTSRRKTPEAMEKGILRRKHGISIFRDGTVRYDMTDIPLTHFRPREIGLSVERARELGYARDWNGDPLTDPEQIVELKCQDIIPAKDCGNYMVRVAQFVDDELEELYDLPRYYNAQNRADLIGRIAFGLAPHTSGCILCRIIGYADVKGCYGHPFYHASKRRNCDGDEDCIILALDGLLNFSKLFLPDRRGGLMDSPLVLTTRLDPNEIDKEAQNIDCLREYPLELYEAAMDMRDPRTIEGAMDLVGGRIGTPAQYEGLGYTHDTPDIAEGPKDSAYTTLDTMIDKMTAQLDLGIKCRAVDAQDVAVKVINKHFMPDMIGNLRSFATQNVRCMKCNTKYRRVPLVGKCAKCGNDLNLTVHEASVRKYLKVSQEVCERYELDDYTVERIQIIESSMDSLFNNDRVKRCKLSDFY